MPTAVVWIGLTVGATLVYLKLRNSRFLFGRSRRRIIHSLPRLPQIAWSMASGLVLIRDPLPFLRHYVSRTTPPSRQVRFRNGITLHTSSCADDIVTAMVIFIRSEYGEIPPGSTILDIGANVGMFSVYACRQGASRIFAYEPCRESFELAKRNVAENGFQGRVVVSQAAVAASSGNKVLFPTKSDPCNRLGCSTNGQATEWVETTTLADILEKRRLEKIDLLKVDCEGAEYDIILKGPDWVWRRIREIRLEYHRSDTVSLIDHLRDNGFRLTKQRRVNDSIGHLWFCRA